MKWICDVALVTACLSICACGIEPRSESETGAAREELSTVTMVYNKGGIVPNVRIIEVLYGAGTYLPGVTNGQLGRFYSDVVKSSYMDWLADYNLCCNMACPNSCANTPTQTIGRGSFANVYMITPSAQNSGTPVSNTQIAAELGAQIAAHNLPATNGGASSKSSNLYMVHLPRGVVANILIGDEVYASSCGPGNIAPDGTFFCGWHSQALAWLPAPATGADTFQYAILPDFGPGSGCDVHRDPDYPNTVHTPCGTSDNFDNLTAIASHELIEAVTDPGGQSWVQDVPAGQSALEIADLCERQDATFVGASGSTWNVQKGWSRTRNACVSHP